MAYEGQRGTIGIEAPQLKSVERILSQINDLHAGIRVARGDHRSFGRRPEGARE
jgi:hypothetical protein